MSIPLFKLHGDLPQVDRTKVYFAFCKAERGILFCTDVGAPLTFKLLLLIVDYCVARECGQLTGLIINNIPSSRARSRSAGGELDRAVRSAGRIHRIHPPRKHHLPLFSNGFGTAPPGHALTPSFFSWRVGGPNGSAGPFWAGSHFPSAHGGALRGSPANAVPGNHPTLAYLLWRSDLSGPYVPRRFFNTTMIAVGAAQGVHGLDIEDAAGSAHQDRRF